jgi:hypothetical protein
MEMEMFMKATIAAIAALTLAPLAAVPASAQTQEGLVTVNISDNNTSVQVPVQVAAEVCGVSVNVIAEKPKNEAVCTITQDQATRANLGGAGSQTQGLTTGTTTQQQ